MFESLSQFEAFNSRTRGRRRGDLTARVSSVTVGTGYDYAASALSLSSPLRSFAPGIGLVGSAAPLMLSLLGLAGTQAVMNSAYRGVRFMCDTDQQVRQLNMGRGFRDSERNQRSRMRAIEEMSGALENSRSYLGREALLLHH